MRFRSTRRRGQKLRIPDRDLCALLLVLLLGAIIGQVLALRSLPYSTSAIATAGVTDLALRPQGRFHIGPVEWDMATYARDPRLQPLRDYFARICGGRRGVDAAVCLSDHFARLFPFGQAEHECLQFRFDPVADLQAHVHGEPGHCVTRSSLLASILLASGIPARYVQIDPLDPHLGGHNVVEVWDDQRGWVLVDPSYGGLLKQKGTPAGALSLLDPIPVKFYRDGKAALTAVNPQRYYAGANNRVRILYPEPWTYMRVGTREAPWPNRALFAMVGPEGWNYGQLQHLLRMTLSVTGLLALCSLLGWVLPRPRADEVVEQVIVAERAVVRHVYAEPEASAAGTGAPRVEPAD